MNMQRLQDTYKPHELAKQQKPLSGYILLNDCDRLIHIAHDDDAKINIDLNCYYDAEGRCVLDGHMQTQVQVACQRCLDAIDLDIDRKFKLVAVQDDSETSELPDEYEPILLKTNEFNAVDLVTDEILLSLPIVPRHEDEECNPALRHLNQNAVVLKQTQQSFAQLAELIKN